MTGYTSLRKFVEANAPSYGRTIRVDCPCCGGRKTFTISSTLRGLVWHCYRASCDVAGATGQQLTIDALRQRLRADSEDTTDTFVLPDRFVNIGDRPHVLEYLEANHVSDAYSEKLVQLRYDPKEDRCVFLVYDQGNLVNAVGRALQPGVKPKWKSYGTVGTPLVVGKGDIAIVVEDCASACAASCFATGVALLGTNVTPEAHRVLRRFRKAVIALDPDATAKALAIQQKMSYYIDTAVAPLPDDLKYFPPDDVQKVLGPYLQPANPGDDDAYETANCHHGGL